MQGGGGGGGRDHVMIMWWLCGDPCGGHVMIT